MFDLVLAGGAIVTGEGVRPATVATKDGKIAAITDPGEALEAHVIQDVAGKLVLPGLVDAHVHIPGHILDTRLDNFTTATQAAAAGGVTTVLLMPTDDPCTITADYFERKREAGEGRSLVNFALQAMVGPRSEPETVAALRDLGAVSFEVFLAYGGMPGYIIGDNDYHLGLVMEMIAEVDGIAGITPHSPSLMTELGRIMRDEYPDDAGVKEMAATRTVLSEALGIARACTAAGEYGTDVHLRALSACGSLDIVRRFKDRGTVSAEVMSHHLVFCEKQARKMGAYGIIVPPIRSGEDRDALRSAAKEGLVDMVVSDHSPCLREDKERGQRDIWLSPPGMPGLQTLLPSMAWLVDQGVMTWSEVVRTCCEQPADRFRLPRKGKIATGKDADLVVVNPNRPMTVRDEDQFSRADYTTLSGYNISSSVERVYLGGISIYCDGAFPSGPVGKFVRPQ